MARTGAANTLLHGAPVVTNLPVTMSCWFMAPNLTGSFALMTLSAATNSIAISMRVAGSAAGDPISARATNASSQTFTVSTSTGYVANEWQHAAAVFNSATDRSIFLNGGSKGSTTVSRVVVNFDDFQLLFERANGEDIAAAIGLHIAECAVWDVGLTDDEIAILAAGYSPLSVRPVSLRNYHPCHGRRGSSAGEEDWMGNSGLSNNNNPALFAGHPRIIYPGRGQRVFTAGSAAAGFRAAWIPRASQFIGAR